MDTRDAYGKRTLVDLLNVENELYQARRQLAEARYDNMLAQYRILAGTGSLLAALGVEPPKGPGRGDEEKSPFRGYATHDLVPSEFAPIPVQTPPPEKGD